MNSEKQGDKFNKEARALYLIVKVDHNLKKGKIYVIKAFRQEIRSHKKH